MGERITLGNNPLKDFVRPDIPEVFNEVSLLEKHQVRALYALENGTVVPPYEIIVHPSARCNLRCEWCIGGRVLEEKEMSKYLLPDVLNDPDNMERVIDGVLSYEKGGFRVENVSFSGITGEPMVARKSVVRAVYMLKDAGLRVGMFSNSVLMDKELMETLLRMDYLNVSLDAGSPETYAKLKYVGRPLGEKLFERVIGNVIALAERKKESGSGLAINASFVLYPDNYREILATAELLKSIGVSTLRVKQDISKQNLLSGEQTEEAQALLSQAETLSDESFRFVTIHRFDRPQDMDRRFTHCYISDLMAAIGSDGNVYPCNYNACVGGVPLGNAVENTFGEVWESGQRMDVRGKIPGICPSVCDPFKTRANALFAAVDETIQAEGLGQTIEYIDEITDTINTD